MNTFNSNWITINEQRINNLFGCKVNTCTTNGCSMYINYRGQKVRFSDHSTSTFSGRHLDEIHVGLNTTKEVVDEMIDRRCKDNYERYEVTGEFVNTEHGIKKMNPGAVKIEKIREDRVTKKGDQMYLFRVTNVRSRYIG